MSMKYCYCLFWIRNFIFLFAFNGNNCSIWLSFGDMRVWRSDGRTDNVGGPAKKQWSVARSAADDGCTDVVTSVPGCNIVDVSLRVRSVCPADVPNLRGYTAASVVGCWRRWYDLICASITRSRAAQSPRNRFDRPIIMTVTWLSNSQAGKATCTTGRCCKKTDIVTHHR